MYCKGRVANAWTRHSSYAKEWTITASKCITTLIRSTAQSASNVWARYYTLPKRHYHPFIYLALIKALTRTSTFRVPGGKTHFGRRGRCNLIPSESSCGHRHSILSVDFAYSAMGLPSPCYGAPNPNPCPISNSHPKPTTMHPCGVSWHCHAIEILRAMAAPMYARQGTS